jgi:hypothetical protein
MATDPSPGPSPKRRGEQDSLLNGRQPAPPSRFGEGLGERSAAAKAIGWAMTSTHCRNVRRVLLVAALFLAAGAALGQIFRRSEFLLTGVVDRFPSRSGEVAVRGRDGETYTLFLREARVDLGPEGNGTWEDLRPGALIDVYGSYRGARQIDATLIRVVGRESGTLPREPVREWTEGSRHEVSGRVVVLDRDRESLRLRAGEETVPVELFDGTRFRTDRGASLRFRDFRQGDTVRVRGEAHSGRLVADELIRLSDRAASGGARAEKGKAAVVEGMVRLPLRYPERTISLRADPRDVEVEVPRDVPVLWLSRSILLHSLVPGDRVRVQGRWDRDHHLVAERVTVLSRVEGRAGAGLRQPEPPRELTGTVVALNGGRTQLRLRTGVGEQPIEIAGARVTLGDRVVGREAIRRGDAVRVLIRDRGGVWVARLVQIL